MSESALQPSQQTVTTSTPVTPEIIVTAQSRPTAAAEWEAIPEIIRQSVLSKLKASNVAAVRETIARTRGAFDNLGDRMTVSEIRAVQVAVWNGGAPAVDRSTYDELSRAFETAMREEISRPQSSPSAGAPGPTAEFDDKLREERAAQDRRRRWTAEQQQLKAAQQQITSAPAAVAAAVAAAAAATAADAADQPGTSGDSGEEDEDEDEIPTVTVTSSVLTSEPVMTWTAFAEIVSRPRTQTIVPSKLTPPSSPQAEGTVTGRGGAVLHRRSSSLSMVDGPEQLRAIREMHAKAAIEAGSASKAIEPPSPVYASGATRTSAPLNLAVPASVHDKLSSPAVPTPTGSRRPRGKLEQKGRVLDMGDLLDPRKRISEVAQRGLIPRGSLPDGALFLPPRDVKEEPAKKSAKPTVFTIRPPPPPVGFARGNADLLLSLIRAEEKLPWTSPALIDYWSSRPLPLEEWTPPATTELRLARTLIDRVVVANGYSLELNWSSVTHVRQNSDKLIVINSEDDFCFYREFIANTPHENFLAPDGPCVVSIETRGRGLCSKAVVRSPEGDTRILLPADRSMKTLKAFMPKLKEFKFKKSKNPALVDDLIEYEFSHNIRSQYKFGLMYCKPWEFDQDALFGATGGSPAYDEFLELIGEKIVLQGWPRYRGGLDVKAKTTGTNSVFSEIKNFQIMFHVSTMLPDDPKDPQRIEKKRHIGNDVVLLVFKDQENPTDTFNPLIINSHFIHCVFVVTPEVDAAGKTTHYWLTIANKPGVPPYPPFLPDPPRFEKGPAFKKFLLTKMINAERSALSGGEFSSISAARGSRLSSFCETYAV